jgi:hypothetical protein
MIQHPDGLTEPHNCPWPDQILAHRPLTPYDLALARLLGKVYCPWCNSQTGFSFLGPPHTRLSPAARRIKLADHWEKPEGYKLCTGSGRFW